MKYIDQSCYIMGNKNIVSNNLRRNKKYMEKVNQLDYIFNKLMNTFTEDKNLILEYDEILTEIESYERKECYKLGYKKGLMHRSRAF